MIKLKDLLEFSYDTFGSPEAYFRNMVQIMALSPHYQEPKVKKQIKKWYTDLRRGGTLPPKSELKIFQRNLTKLKNKHSKDERAITMIGDILKHMN